MAVPYRSCTYGLLFYHPSAETTEPTRSPKLYRPRRVGPGRIQIKPVAHYEYDRPKATLLLHNSRKRLSVKLAVSRENAKRFLRSVIANPNPPEPSQIDDAGRRKSKRRSWAPVKPTEAREEPPSSADDEAAGEMRGNIRASISGPVNAAPARQRGTSDITGGSRFGARRNGANQDAQSPGSGVGSVIPEFDMDSERPVAAGNGVSVGIHLAEPVLFLQGFDNADNGPGNTAMLRGSLHIRVQKSAKIKAVTLKFKGKAMTKWPEGIPPRKVDYDETDTIMSHTWPFFNAQFESAEQSTNADHTRLFKGTEGATSSVTRLDPLGRSSPNASHLNVNSKDAKKLALSVNQSRSFGRGESQSGGPNVAAKGYRMFLPGDYIYNFELPLDSRLPETIDVDLGSVKYELEASVERSGAFRANLLGTKEVSLIRAPAEGSLEQVEPIAISRNWEDQLHYDIVISGKSFPLGSQVPIAFKLTPLAKVQCHRIKVLITENIEYFCSNKRVHRMEPTRKVQLFEKRADGPPTSTFPGSTMRVTSGGGIPYDARARAARGEDVAPSDPTNLLGNLEGDTNIGPTEMEFNVQLPSCHAMKERERAQKLHFDTTYQNIQVHHWIKIVMRLSKPDTENPGKRRHFEISIDSPFHILSCRATRTNISLPAYTTGDTPPPAPAALSDCGCPGAAVRPTTFSTPTPAPPPPSTDPPSDPPSRPALARPPTAHLGGPSPAGPAPQRPSSYQPPPTSTAPSRPMHLLRAPSFNPPAFSESDPPPPLQTPPPNYDSIASPTSGLADYFSRLGDAYDDEDEEDGGSRSGRVNVPLTPGGRINRSMDLGRRWVPVGQ